MCNYVLQIFITKNIVIKHSYAKKTNVLLDNYRNGLIKKKLKLIY